MTMPAFSRLMLLISFVAGLSACTQNGDNAAIYQDVIQQRVAERVDEFLALQRKICSDRSLRKAIALAQPILDSLENERWRETRARLLQEYNFVGVFRKGEACVNKGELWGVVNTAGELIVPLREDKRRFPLKEGRARTKKCNCYGFVDAEGKMVVAPTYQDATNFSGGIALVKLYDLWGAIQPSGKVAIPLVYDSLDFDGELVKVYQEELQGYLYPNGKAAVPLVYEETSRMFNAFRVVKDRQVGVLDKNAKPLLPLAYDEVGDFIEGRARLKLNEQYGFAGDDGKVIVAPKYDAAENFRSGVAVVMLDGKYGYINRAGQEIIPLQYEFAATWTAEGLKVTANGRERWLDTKGKCIKGCQ